MADETPEDVAALLSHSKLNQYKVFTQDRRTGEHRLPAPSMEPAQLRSTTNSTDPEASKLEFVRASRAPRWALLHDLGCESESTAPLQDSRELRVPTFAVVATGGGAGKTTVSATLGRALSLMGDNVLMIHGVKQPSTPLHFGAQFAQAGRLRTYVPPLRDQGTVHMLSHQFDGELQQSEESGTWLGREVNSLQSEIDRCIVEISTIRGQEAPMMNLSQVCLVVLAPDMNSVMALAPFRRLSERVHRPGVSRSPSVYFLINKFDPGSAFHAEVRQNLRLQLGPRLLPFCIRRNDSIAEALAAGMTVLDYAPNSAPAEDFQRLASWAREISVS